MNDEIKEILNRLDFNEWEVDLYKVPITWCELFTIRDYITNLQHENERLKKKNDSLGETNLRINGDLKVAKQDRIEYSNELEDYKSRIEKAVEYIGEYKDYCDKEVCDCTPEYFEDLLDILNGRSDE